MRTLCITNGRVIDPSQGFDQVSELWIRGENILAVGPQPQLRADQVLDAAGKTACPCLRPVQVPPPEPPRGAAAALPTGPAAPPSRRLTRAGGVPHDAPGQRV